MIGAALDTEPLYPTHPFPPHTHSPYTHMRTHAMQASGGCDDSVDMLLQHHADPTAKYVMDTPCVLHLHYFTSADKPSYVLSAADGLVWPSYM